MKYFKNIFCFFTLTGLLVSCQDDFLDLVPKDELTEKTTFTSYENILTYAWGFYDVFPGYVPSIPTSERNGDLFLRAAPNSESDWIWQRITVPGSSSDWNDPYRNIRRINIMLDNLDGSGMDQTSIDHWRSVGYFFRSYNYFELVKKYGSVPWIEHAVGDNDNDVVYGPRTPRDEVTGTMLEQLLWAEEHIKPEGDGPNTVNVHAVRALLSRFGLFEGTWRKYHALGGEEVYLRACAEASEKLMSSFPDLHPSFDEVFNSESLAGVAGVILFKPYASNQYTHGQTARSRNSSGRYDLTRKAVDMYLMTDGETRWTSPLFEGDKSPYTEFRNRDRRFYFTVTPPYEVETPSTNSTEWSFTSDPVHREYIDLMNEISDPVHKTLPQVNWREIVLRQVPHYFDDRKGQGFIISYTGYYYWKNYNRILNNIDFADISDAPVFRMGEILVNYAEAKFELGEFDQGTVDQTINKLRERGYIAGLDIGSIPDDPTRDPAVDPVLWEIRRERAVELMGEGYRPDDLRRWKKMDYVTERKLGRWIKRSEVKKVPILNGASEGYIDYYGEPPAEFPGYYYLWPIPSDQIVLNPQLKQNPGWE
ncbi:RagB/SusD family nutrient uptake outer membrane protein [Sinomicrobium soli]|uniref:RagB/SusD family nutrient uptake outer membrane protein n=1 Tax=Sinomicrobium sp. N-1-3-6 TaxID=2219864 RepID=UPI000DCB3D01|nr:RagB/SusD family nutrient uptake outer membrane protein [Sinomicrobium sp. N-1-3-6]RAV30241.1 RagB/SusD family nutrient uptake outer membrane protein [Sinomicrobium sp. N-1-3-6]